MDNWLFIVILVASAAFLFIRHVYEKSRSESWNNTAESMGFRFDRENSDILNSFSEFRIIASHGHSHKAKNVIRGQKKGAKIFIFCLQSTFGSSGHATKNRITVCILLHRGLQLPHIYCTPPQGFFDNRFKNLGKQDINFDSDPGFSTAYVLQGEDEERIRARFTPAIREWFFKNRGQRMTFEAKGDTMMVTGDRRMKPGKALALMQNALDLSHLFLEEKRVVSQPEGF
jgi:hypothetical protein